VSILTTRISQHGQSERDHDRTITEQKVLQQREVRNTSSQFSSSSAVSMAVPVAAIVSHTGDVL
jgi:hypothetical protein